MNSIGFQKKYHIYAFLTQLSVVFFIIFLFNPPVFSKAFKFETDIISAYKKHVIDYYPIVDPETVTVVIKERDMLSVLSNDSTHYRLDIPRKSDVMGRTVVPISFLSKEGKVLANTNMVVDVDAKASLFRVNKTIRRGKTISKDDIEMVAVSLQPRYKNPVVSEDEIVGKLAKSTIASHTVLTDYMLKTSPAIRIGTGVDVMMRHNGFELKVRGKSLDDGSIGETVRVQTQLESRKIINAEVINETTVRYFSYN